MGTVELTEHFYSSGYVCVTAHADRIEAVLE
jgi:hypothetical protein